jgi:hypothetical protein
MHSFVEFFLCHPTTLARLRQKSAVRWNLYHLSTSSFSLVSEMGYEHSWRTLAYGLAEQFLKGFVANFL